MQFARKLFSFLWKSLLGILLFFMILLTVLWIKPESFLHEENVKRALRLTGTEFQVQWSRFRWDFERKGFLGKRMILETDNLCVRAPSTLNACFHKTLLDLSFSLKGLQPRIVEITHFVLDGKHLNYFASPSEKVEEKPSSPLPDLRPPKYRDYFPPEVDLSLVKDLYVRMPQFTFKSPDAAAMSGKLAVEKKASRKEDLRLEAMLEANRKDALDLQGSFDILISKESLALRGSAKGKLQEWGVDLPVDLRWADQVKLEASPRLSRPKEVWHANVSALMDVRDLRFTVSDFALPQLLLGRELIVKKCGLHSELARLKGFPKESDLECEFLSTTKRKNSLVKEITATLRTKIDLDLIQRDRVGIGFDFTGNGDGGLFRGDIDGSGKLNLNSISMKLESVDNPKFHARFDIPKFEQWRAALDGTPFAIPAPVRVLRGPMQVDANLASASQEQLQFALVVDTNLREPQQSLVTQTNVTIDVLRPFLDSRAFQIAARTVLKDIRLEAPPLELDSPPQALPDSRFVSSKEVERERREAAKAKKGPKVDWTYHVETEAPVRVATNLLRNPIPFHVNLRMSSESSLAGYVEVQPMPIQLFRRAAEVQTVRVTFHEGSDVGNINGTVVYRNPEVRVNVYVLGSTEEPRVEFESDPPLNRQQIVSLILFNKPLHQLTEEEANSTGNMSQALADGAFGLFSLFFLSSTPIESVGYDPASGAYSVQVRLGGKTTVSVASDFEEERRFTFRRRLGGRWSIRTELQQDEDQGNVALALLEWLRRF